MRWFLCLPNATSATAFTVSQCYCAACQALSGIGEHPSIKSMTLRVPAPARQMKMTWELAWWWEEGL